ncbi:unnamed protein product [Clonostachys rosea]|uniref:lytic cellulose monooxygenase (C4-dehydrogenating) n=1 Tax=Bionectria ochroleuca TaxID=29856 RepID=A0ABY6U8P2_BIOOC|nr:unnamed protein product [Clonostachys rosea]
MHNGQQIGGEYDYVRRNSNSYNPAFMDIVNSNDLRCNVGATAGSTKTYDVKAGDRIGLKVFNNEDIEHPGPGFFYMSKAPGSVANYDGSGDWFKVWQSGPVGAPNTNEGWGTWRARTMEFNLPKSLPDGEYLLRGEHIGIHENHIECAQIRVTGGGSGTPSPTVKIPGVYKTTDPALTYNFWGSGGAYQMPGPAVWSG